LVVVSFGGCQDEGFECGRVIDGTSTVRRCDRALEICVCSTGSCAKKVGPAAKEVREADGGSGGAPDANASAEPTEGCETGYRYVDAPFARAHLAGECVSKNDMDLTPIVPSEEAPGPACVGVTVPEAGPDASGGAPPDDPMNTGGHSGGGASQGGTGGAGASGAPASGGDGGQAGAGNPGGGGENGGQGGLSGSSAGGQSGSGMGGQP
jgi:hypothetical protein